MLVPKSLLFLPHDISQILLLAVYRERFQTWCSKWVFFLVSIILVSLFKALFIVYLEFGLDSTKIIIFKEPKTSPTLVKEKK